MSSAVCCAPLPSVHGNEREECKLMLSFSGNRNSAEGWAVAGVGGGGGGGRAAGQGGRKQQNPVRNYSGETTRSKYTEYVVYMRRQVQTDGIRRCKCDVTWRSVEHGVEADVVADLR